MSEVVSPLLELRGVCKAFPTEKGSLEVLRELSLSLEEGSFTVLLGHSGCGKSTLLRIIAGLETHQGELLLNGRRSEGVRTECGMVFQDHRLLPWLRVRENVAFGLRCSRREREQLVRHNLALVGLEAFADTYPSQLSGGMSQRAALARGLAAHPRLLLLDEPFCSLDALARGELHQELLRIWRTEKNTLLLVTHDIDEAVFLGQRVIVLTSRPGQIKASLSLPEGLRRGTPAFARYTAALSGLLSEDDAPCPH